MKSLFKVTPLRLALVLAVMVSGIIFFQDQRNWLEWFPYRMELRVLDAKFAFRGPIKMDPQVVIAAVDEKALEAFGVFGGWPRSVYSRMMGNLFKAGADVVAFDMVWGDEQQTEGDMLKLKNLEKGFSDGKFDERAKAA